MTNIFKISAEILELQRIMEQEETIEGSHDDIAQFLIPAKEEALQKKIDAYVHVVRNIRARQSARKNEAKELTAMAQADANQIERLKEAVRFVSQQLDMPKLEGITRTITVSSRTPAIEIVDEDAIPDEYKEWVTTCKISKKGISEHLKETGEVVDGVELKEVVAVRFR